MMPIYLKRQHRRPTHDGDGILRKIDKITGEEKEFCVTSQAKGKRRGEIFALAKGLCERCGIKLDFIAPWWVNNSMHWHHKIRKSHGGSDTLSNGECLCRDCHLVGEHKQF